MSTTAVGKMKLTEHAPPGCSSCFQQNVDVRHVDFGAYWDGPVLDGAKGVMIDDLIVCENCLREAASLVGLVDPADTAERIERAAQRIAEAEGKVEGQAKYIAHLEAAVSTKAELQPRTTRKKA